jgi:hypothetical protein
MEWRKMGFTVVIAFTRRLHVVTTSNYSAVANSHAIVAHCSTHWAFSVRCVFTSGLCCHPHGQLDVFNAYRSVSSAIAAHCSTHWAFSVRCVLTSILWFPAHSQLDVVNSYRSVCSATAAHYSNHWAYSVRCVFTSVLCYHPHGQLDVFKTLPFRLQSQDSRTVDPQPGNHLTPTSDSSPLNIKKRLTPTRRRTYCTVDGRSVSLLWYGALLWASWPDVFPVHPRSENLPLLKLVVLSDERTGLCFDPGHSGLLRILCCLIGDWACYTPGHWVPILQPLSTHRGCGGGILARIHKGTQSQSYITTDGQPASVSWCYATLWDVPSSSFPSMEIFCRYLCSYRVLFDERMCL